MLSQLEFQSCPGQDIFITCGLFSVGVILHLIANLEVESSTFNQANISHLQNLLGCFLHNRSIKVPSSLIRDCFLCLKGTTIVGQDGIEEVDVASPTGADTARMSTSTRSASAPGTRTEADESLDLTMETMLQDTRAKPATDFKYFAVNGSSTGCIDATASSKPYWAAYQTLTVESNAASEEQKLGFQLLIPYLKKFKEANAGSFV